ncbi:hypothetical protein SEA_BECKERTON_82 [Mycobacterium phage Beckerton]|nr:hypothetical protein SEA_BECKERTON_82 [Mycobacterium phage Beckerton]
MTDSMKFTNDFVDNLIEMVDRMWSVFEAMPTRGQALYAVINKPWVIQNWVILPVAWPITKRKVRKGREKLDDLRLIRWASKLNDGKEFRAQ